MTVRILTGDCREVPRDTGRPDGAERRNPGGGQKEYDSYRSPRTTGWSPSCACDADPIPATVLDCFAGAGTVGLVADRLGRDAILIDLNPDYADMARKRIEGDAPLLAKVAAE